MYCSMVAVAQLVRAPDCGSGGRGFDPHQPPSWRLCPKGDIEYSKGDQALFAKFHLWVIYLIL